MSGIAGIRARAEAYATHGTPGAAAPRDRASLLALIDAIESLMQDPEHYGPQGPHAGFVSVELLRRALSE